MKTITFRVPHNVRMSLGILSASVGDTISEYVRRILETYTDEITGEFTGTHFDKWPSKTAWQQVSLTMRMDLNGPVATLCVRIPSRVAAALSEAAVYSTASIVRSAIKTHIIKFSRMHPIEKIAQQTDEIIAITRKCKACAEKLADDMTPGEK